MAKRAGAPQAGRPAKRAKQSIVLESAFRFKSEQAKKNDLKLEPASLLRQAGAEEADEGNETALARAVAQQAHLNSSGVFLELVRTLRPLCYSVPQVLHHASAIVSALADALTHKDAELAAEATLSLIPALFATLPDAQLLVDTVPPVFAATLSLGLNANKAAIVEKAFQTLALFFRELAKAWIKTPAVPWDLVREHLGAASSKSGDVEMAEPVFDGEEAEKPLKAALPSPALRRLLASAFAFLVRKARGEGDLQRLLDLLFDDAATSSADVLNESVATILFESVKAVDGRLQSRADLILKAVVEHPKASSAITEQLITSLAQYANESSLDTIGQVLLSIQPTPVRLLRLLGLPDAHRKAIYQRATDLTAAEVLQLPDDLIEWSVHLMLASETSEAHLFGRPIFANLLKREEVRINLSLIRESLECAQSRSHALALADALASLDWSHFDAVALPVLLPALLPRVTHAPDIEAFLATLASSGRLKPSTSPSGFVDGLLVRLGKVDAAAMDEVETLRLVNQLSLFRVFCADSGPVWNAISTLVSRLASHAPARTAFDDSPVGSALLLATCLSILPLGPVELFAEVVNSIVVNYHWHVGVLSLLAEVKRSASPLSDSARLRLLDNIVGELPALRAASLALLGTSSPLLKLLNDIERTPLTFHLARERCVKLKRVAGSVRNAEEADLAARYLTGSLKLNFKPVWEESIAGLVELSKRYGDQVWPTLSTQLGLASKADESILLASKRSWHVEMPMVDEDEERDVIGEAVEDALRVARDGWQAAQRHAVAKTQSASYRLDLPHLEAELLRVFERSPDYAQKHNAFLVELFYSLELSGKRLASWLSMFAKMPGPKSMARHVELHATYLGYLSHGDTEIAKLALACLLKWKTPALLAFEEQLYGLLDASKFRDTLLGLSLSTTANVIQPDFRVDLVPVVIRILFGVATSKQMKSTATARRGAILTSLRSCTADELDTLVDLMLAPFADVVKQPWSDVEPKASPKQQIGFLHFLADVLKHLSAFIHANRLPQLCAATCGMLRAAQGQTSVHARVVRVQAIARFADFFRLPEDVVFDAEPFLAPAFKAFISPRLGTLASETAQAPSGLLELAIIWAGKRETVPYLVEYDARFLEATFETLSVSTVKPAVVSRILDLLQLLLSYDDLADQLIKPYMSSLLTHLAALLSSKHAGDARSDLDKKQMAVLAGLAPFVVDRAQASQSVDLLLPLLAKPNRVVPESVKLDLLKIVTSLLPVVGEASSGVRATLSSLFAYIRSRAGRMQLVQAFEQVAVLVPTLQVSAQLLVELNAYSARRLDEPDFDRRLAAFAQLNESLYRTLTGEQWTPLLYNMLSFIQDVEELSMRTNATFALRRFIEMSHIETVSDVLLPGLMIVLRSKEEMVRSEALGVLGKAVAGISGLPLLDELKVLLVGGDVEANVFDNLLHIQTHRRARAMRRLAEEAEAGRLSSKTLADLWVPLVGHFLEVGVNVDLANEAVVVMGRLARCLNWSVYYRLLQDRLGLASTAEQNRKLHVRVAVSLLKGFHFGGDERVMEVVKTRLMPRLVRFLEHRQEQEEEMRIPMAEGIAALVPFCTGTEDASTLMTSLAQILRSKSQDVRDQARQTLCNIGVSLGASYLALMARDLAAALKLGAQVHVLAFTLHAVLVKMVPLASVEDVDEALEHVMPVLAEDLFGAPAKAREDDNYRKQSTYREVKTCKSLDSILLLSGAIGPASLSKLLLPLRQIMQRTESLKTLRVVDDCLGRVSQGIQSNSRIDTFALLSLCNTLVSLNADFLRPLASDRGGRGVSRDHEVRLTKSTSGQVDHYARNSHRFVGLGLDLLNASFRHNRFDLHDAETIARLDPLITAVGEAVYARDSAVLVKALRATAALMRCPLASVDRAGPILTKRILAIVLGQGGTQSETVQAGLRTLSTIIRDCKAVQLSEDDLTSLVKLVAPDLEEAERQVTAFSVLRALLSRQFACAEVYDVMDRVAEVLVTNQAASVREACRAIYLQFLLDYPHGKTRLSTSMSFLVRNLDYVFESGRTSVMELLGAIITKFSPALLDPSAELFFVGLVMAVVNAESTRARETALELVKVLVGRVSGERRASYLALLQTWSAQDSQKQLAVVALQLLAVMIETGTPEAVSAAPRLLEMLIQSIESAEQLEEDAELDGELSWRPLYQALQAVVRIFAAQPALLDPASSLWPAVVELLLFPHVWVRTSAARLLGTLFATSPTLEPELLIEMAVKSSLQLCSPLLTDAVALQIVKNLFFVGRSVRDTAEEAGEEYDRETQPLRWLFARMGKQARQAHAARPSMYEREKIAWSLQPASIFRWFAAMTNALDAELLSIYLLDMLNPLLRVVDDPNVADPQLVELQTLAREVLDLIQAKVGITPYSAAYASLKASVADKKQARKTEMATRAVVDPELTGLLKAKRNATKKAQKKRKNEAMSAGRPRAHAEGIKRVRRDV